VDASLIMPFIQSAQNLFVTMLRMEVQVGKPTPVDPNNSSVQFDVSGIIGMSGDMEGSVILSFADTTAEQVVSQFTGMTMSRADEDFSDAVGELVNIIAGGAKSKFEGKNVNLTCPSVVIGNNHVVHGRKGMVGITIPCRCKLGNFNIDVMIKKD
jgi:chemotaxis protein CheX